MKRMKKITRSLLSVVLVLAMILLCGCGNDAGGAEPETEEVQGTEEEAKENEAKEQAEEKEVENGNE